MREQQPAQPVAARAKRYVVAITGASGSLYALRLIELLVSAGCKVYLIATNSAMRTLREEVDLGYARSILQQVEEVFDNQDIGASVASGTFRFDALIVVPCSVNTVATIHSNAADTLIGRCAVVAQKERRRMIIVPRETPISTLTLKQLYELSALGIDVLMAAPGFYYRPQSVADLVDFIAGKALSLLGFDPSVLPEWKRNSLLEGDPC
ncbi:MAG: putative aromatic acid decarboxylase [Myxococcaceae bacterium]|nr:putative aromatic acid decarboxylase [Myxococcaceae bacterium]